MVAETVEKVANETARVPGNLMRLLEHSYGTRERQLDWLLALVAVSATVFAFWPQLRGAIYPAAKNLRPNDDVAGALPADPSARYMTYNLPPARTNIAHRRGPTMVPIPNNPSYTPAFPVTPETYEVPEA